MKASVAALVMAFAALLVVPLGHDRAAAASVEVLAQHWRSARAADLSARRRGHVRDRTDYPYYLGRPQYYSPGPFFPWLPFIPAWQDNPLGW
jgi:hypothetical protein